MEYSACYLSAQTERSHCPGDGEIQKIFPFDVDDIDTMDCQQEVEQMVFFPQVSSLDPWQPFHNSIGQIGHPPASDGPNHPLVSSTREYTNERNDRENDHARQRLRLPNEDGET